MSPGNLVQRVAVHALEHRAEKAPLLQPQHTNATSKSSTKLSVKLLTYTYIYTLHTHTHACRALSAGLTQGP